MGTGGSAHDRRPVPGCDAGRRVPKSEAIWPQGGDGSQSWRKLGTLPGRLPGRRCARTGLQRPSQGPHICARVPPARAQPGSERQLKKSVQVQKVPGSHWPNGPQGASDRAGELWTRHQLQSRVCTGDHRGGVIVDYTGSRTPKRRWKIHLKNNRLIHK